MPYVIGLILALVVAALARRIHLDRDSAFYPTVLMVVASYYVLFAVIGQSTRATAIETVVMITFVIVAVVGFRKNLWLVAGGLATHAVFDWFHGAVVVNSGVPSWWPGFCLSYDAAAASILAALLINSRTMKSPVPLTPIGSTNANHA